MTSRPSRHQLRRQARRLRRDGFQPMMVFNQGDRLPETAAVAIGRALWRYRSELAPIAFAVLTVAVAAEAAPRLIPERGHGWHSARWRASRFKPSLCPPGCGRRGRSWTGLPSASTPVP